jgi:integrase
MSKQHGTRRSRRDAHGQFEAVPGKRGTTFRLRITLPRDLYPDASGAQRRPSETLGRNYGSDAIDRREAEARAERLLAQVRLGQYRTRAQRAADRAAVEAGRVEAPTFYRFAEEWLDRRRVLGGRRGRGLSESGESDLSWRLAHLNGWFAGMTLDQITEEEVERFAAAKRAAAVGEGGLSATSTNKMLSTLEAIMLTAVRHRRIERNPVAGFRVPGARYVAPILSTAAQASALLDAADVIDRRGRLRQGHGRALLATLLYGGLRIDEALSLRWRDVRLPEQGGGATRRLRAVEEAGWVKVREGKTENAERTVDLLPPLAAELADLRARRAGERDALVFGTARGKKDSASNVRCRLLAPAVEIANAALERAEEETIPDGLTPHGLRHTHVSVRFLLGEEAGYVADQVGHADAGFTYSRYRKRINRRDGEVDRLRDLFSGAAPSSAPEPERVAVAL